MEADLVFNKNWVVALYSCHNSFYFAVVDVDAVDNIDLKVDFGGGYFAVACI